MKKMHKGFTLVELLIVIAILGALSASMSLSAKDATPKAQAARIVSDFKLLKTAVMMYRIDSDDTTPTVTYFSKHSQDYLAGRLKDFKLEESTATATKGQWLATYTGPLSVAANAALKDSKDLGITKATGSGAIGTKTVKLQMRIY